MADMAKEDASVSMIVGRFGS